MEAPSANYNNFIIEYSEDFDDSMIDYAKMSILFGFSENPNNLDKISEIIVNKFYERYKGVWGVCIIQDGANAACKFYYERLLFIKYKVYLIKIYQTAI